MIPEFLNLQNQIAERAKNLGRIIQQHHYASSPEITPFPACVPTWNGIQGDYACIAIGRDNTGVINVPVPIGLFETAGESDIRIWIYSQNAEFQRAQTAQDDSNSAAVRKAEIEMLHRLRMKYPEELCSNQTKS